VAYCVLADIQKILPEDSLIQLTDDENAGAVNALRVSEAIAQADAEIDAYLGGKYTVPMTTVPDIVKKCSVDMAIYHLYSRRAEEIPRTRDDRYKRAIKVLEDIVSGKIPSIGEATEPAASSELDQIKITRTSGDKVFSRGKKSDGSGGSLDNY